MMTFASRTHREMPAEKFSRRTETAFALSRSWESGSSRSVPSALILRFEDLSADEIYHAFRMMFERFGYPRLTWIVETK